MLSERELRPVWYGNTPPSLFLRVLAGLYGSLAAARRQAYRRRWLRVTQLPVPVIVVGNISVGGTGKTPLTLALIEELRLRGFVPGVVSRGYGGKAKKPVLLDSQSIASDVGDEPMLIADTSGAPVAIGHNRVASARLVLSAARVDVLIADDGLQHYRLSRDVEICVIDGERRFGNARLLPAGPLREPVERLDSVDFRVCNGAAPQAGEFAMILHGDIAVALADRSICRPLGEFRGTSVHAVAGIGHPARFFAQLRAAGVQVIEHPFADHHAFRAADLDFGDTLPVLMTDKDAVKCRAFADARLWSVPVRATLSTEFFDAVAARLRTGIAKGQVPTSRD
jgi:tetraacyldisaccharide 4'-kinase